MIRHLQFFNLQLLAVVSLNLEMKIIIQFHHSCQSRIFASHQIQNGASMDPKSDADAKLLINRRPQSIKISNPSIVDKIIISNFTSTTVLNCRIEQISNAYQP